jgi:hypothetical protein
LGQQGENNCDLANAKKMMIRFLCKKENRSTFKSFLNLQPFLESYQPKSGSLMAKKKRSLPV